MPLRVREFLPTPNPNALKCVLEGGDLPACTDAPRSGPRSYASPQAAAHDPLGFSLLQIPGVRNVLIVEGSGNVSPWVTVGKDPHLNWSALRPLVSQAVERIGGGT